MNTLQLCKYLISINGKLIDQTAMTNCHCIGLNSFIINERPKIRLFIAAPNCELFDDFDYFNPIIPIHPHKYDDLFSQLEGTMINHLYKVGGPLEFNKYQYKRLSDKKTDIELLGKVSIEYLGGKSDISELKSTELHTASLQGKKCSWMVTETFKNEKFEQVAYHQNLVGRTGLYVPMVNSKDYLNSYFNLKH